MAHELLRLASKIYNTPHLITQSSFEGVVDYIQKRNEGLTTLEPQLAIADVRPRSLERLQYNTDTKVGIIPVEGSLSYVAYNGLCSGESASYQRILSDFKTMADAGAKVIVVDADSGGGEAYGMMETSAQLRKIADDKGIKYLTYVDGIAGSAMYGLAAASHEVIANPDANLGSIGVVVSLANYSEAEKRYGIKKTFITAGEGKVPFTSEGEFTQDFLDDIQTKVDKLYEKFTSHVAEYRPMSKETIKSLGAKMYTAEDSVALNLADKIQTREEFFNYLADLTQKGGNMSLNPFSKKTKATTTTEETAMSDKDVDVQAQLASLKEEMAAQMAEFQAASEAKLVKEQAEKAELRAALEAIQKEKQEAKAAERLAELSALFGDTEAPTLNASLASLDDAAFAAVVKTFEAKSEKKDEEMTAEIGEEGKVVVTSSAATVEELNAAQQERLKNKYSKKGAK